MSLGGVGYLALGVLGFDVRVGMFGSRVGFLLVIMGIIIFWVVARLVDGLAGHLHSTL